MTKRPAHHLTPLADDPAQPSYIRELLDAGRNARVSGYDFDHAQAMHVARVQVGTAMPDWAKSLESGAAGAASVTATGASGSLLGWVAGSVVAAAVLTAAVLTFYSEPGDAPARPHTLSPATTQTPVAPSGTSPRAPGDVRAASAQSPQATQAAEPGTAVLTRHSANAAATRVNAPSAGASGSRPRVVSSPRASASGSVAQVPASAAPVSTAKSAELFASARPAVTPQPRSEEPAVAAEAAPVARPAPVPPAPAPVDDARLEREMGMLAVAQRVLRDDPARALKLTRQGEVEFHDSMFTEERQQLLLLALVKLGRLEEARQLAKPYLARFPHGPYSERVRRALASGELER